MAAPFPYPLYRKLSMTVLKPRSATDLARVPAAGVDLIPYKRGAIASAIHALTVGAGRTLNVRDTSMIAVNDVLQVGTSATSLATVTAIASAVALTVTISVGTFNTAANDRLVLVGPAGRIPTIYTDPAGVTSTASLLTDAAGYAQCFLQERSADVLVGMNFGGITPSLREAETSGNDEIWIDASNYTSIQAAIDAVPATLGTYAGTVFLPAGNWDITATLLLNKTGIVLKGAGRYATTLRLFASNNTDILNVSKDYCRVEDMAIGGSAAAGSGRGIVLGSGGTGGCGFFHATNVTLYDTPSWAIEFTGGAGTGNYVSWTTLDNVRVERPRSNGCVSLGAWTYLTKIRSCQFDCSGSGVGYALYGANLTCLDVDTCELTPATNTKAVFIDSTAPAGAIPANRNIRIANCDIETAAGSTDFALHIKGCRNLTMQVNYFYTFTNAVKLEDCIAPLMLGNYYGKITTTHVTLTNCIGTVFLAERAATWSPEATALFVWAEAGTTAGTSGIVNGVVIQPKYTTANLPAGAAGSVITGAMAYDSTTNTLKVLRNDGATWANVP